MPLILEIGSDQIYKQGDGWKITTLAGHVEVGSPALVVRRWSLQARARTSQMLQEGDEEILYVIRGSGEAIVDKQCYELSIESMLWLEQGDIYELIAGEAGLEVLQGCAPSTG